MAGSYKLLVLAIGATLLAQTAAAETATIYENLIPGSDLAAYLAPANGLRAMYEVADRVDRNLGRVCAEDAPGRLIWMGAFIDSPVTLEEGANHPSAGLWAHRFTVTRCGRTQDYQAALLAVPGQEPQVVALAPGQTLAGPILQQDARRVILPNAFVISGQSIDACKQGLVTNTQVIDAPRAVPRNSELGKVLNDHALISASLILDQAQVSKRASTITQFDFMWIEQWSLRLCDVGVDVPIAFFSNPYTDGISFVGPTKPGFFSEPPWGR